MPWRLVFAVLVVVVALGVNAYLLSTEEISTSEQQIRHTAKRQDPLLDLSYTSGQRQQNFAAFGLTEAEVKDAMKRIGDYQDLHSDRLMRLLDQAPELVEVADALCGTTKSIVPRYGALRYLVSEKGGERIPVDLRRFGGFKREEWSYVSTIDGVYQEVELRESRQEDATKMGIAAILAGEEAMVLENRTPYGRSLAPWSWSWSKVVSNHPGLDERVIKYLAMMHLTVELARSEGGICNF